MMTKSRLNRRTVLRSIGVVGATAAISPTWQAFAADARTAVVVGSGIAGLSAAYDLQKAGFAVTVFEKRHMAGGRMRLDWMGPLYGEVHAEEIWEGNLEMLALADEIGISNEFTVNQPDGPMTELQPVDNGDGVYGVATRFHTTEILSTPGFSDDLKQGLLTMLPDLAEIRATVDPCLLHTGAAWDNESLFDYLAGKTWERGSSQVCRRLGCPRLVGGVGPKGGGNLQDRNAVNRGAAEQALDQSAGHGFNDEDARIIT